MTGGWNIDNNTVERSTRPLALTRKNALFAGSDEGAGHWAAIASLIETCKPNGVDPQAYMTAVITLIAQGHPNSRIVSLCHGNSDPLKRSLTWHEDDAYLASELSIRIRRYYAAVRRRRHSGQLF